MKRILFLSMIGLLLNVCAMELPAKRGSKRPAPEFEESEEDVELVASAPEKNERKTREQERAELEMVLEKLKATELSDLPVELQQHIVSFILDAQGPTRQARLYNAAENIRNYMQSNKAYYGWLSNPFMTNFIILQLASKYTSNNDVTVVVQALGTDQASRWLGQKVNQAMSVNPQQQETFTDDNAAIFVYTVSSHIAQAVKSNSPDLYFLLTKYIAGANKAWLINKQSVMGLPLVMYASLYPDHIILNDILQTAGLNINNPDVDGRTILHAAVESGTLHLVQQLLARPDIQIDARTAQGETPLMTAIAKHNLDIVNALLSKGAAVNIFNHEGISPLIKAVIIEDPDIITRLLQVPTLDINLQSDELTGTALHFAAVTNPKILQLLLNAQTNPPIQVDARDVGGVTPLGHAVYYVYPREMIDMLVRAGADVDAQDNLGYTPLMQAAVLENSEPLQILIGHHASVNIRDNAGHTALWHARSKNNNEQNINILLQAGATE